MWVPNAIMRLIEKKVWHTLLIPHHKIQSLSEHLILPFPPTRWIEALGTRLGAHRPECKQNLDRQVASSLAKFVREHAPHALSRQEPHAVTRHQMLLERSVNVMDTIIESFDKKAGSSKRVGKHNDNLIVASLLASLQFRDRSSLASVWEGLIKGVVPKTLQHCVFDTSAPLPHASTICKKQIYVDATYERLFGEQLLNADGPIFLCCDSSVQAKTDWMLSMIDFIPQAKLLECVDAFHTLMRAAAEWTQAWESDNVLAMETVVARIKSS